jgi:DNA-binding NarL/FixJ family response regulator
MTIRVAIADDQAMIRNGFRLQVQYADDLELVGEASNGEQAVSLARSQAPDVLLMDVRMPVMDGIEATRRISADPELVGVRVLILTTFDLDEHVYDALRAGASGFLLKDTSPEDLHRAVQLVAEGGSLISPQVTRRLVAQFCTPNRARDRGAEAGRTRTVQHRARPPAHAKPLNDKDPRQPNPDQAPTARPRTIGSSRLRKRPRHTR